MSRRRRKKKRWKTVLLVLLLLILLIAGFIALFMTREIEVEGNEYYGDGTITSWIEQDPLSANTVYLLLKYNYAGGEIPSAAESFSVSLENPWTIIVTVTEKDMIGYVDYDDARLYFDEDGIACLRTGTEIDGVPYIEGLEFTASAVTIGEELPVEDETIFKKLKQTGKYLAKYGLNPDRIVCGQDDSDVVLYFGDVEVLLGSENYDDRIAQLVPILAELTENYPDTAGTLHLEDFDSSEDSVRFVPEE